MSIPITFTKDGGVSDSPLVIVKASDISIHPITPATTEKASAPRRDWRFWAIFVAISVSMFTSSLELSAVSTALPTIANDLQGGEFTWVGSAYALSSTAFLPMSGGLAQVFGRRPAMLLTLFFFSLGSVLCGVSTSMNFLIAARTIQGLGSGGVTALSQIVLSDMVSLRERGIFNGLLGIFWSVAACIGPVVGGSLAERGQWRWLFYLNLFTSGFSAVLVIAFLNMKTPAGTIREKLGRMDWIGNAIVIPSASSVVIALTWGGIQYPWSSPRVLVPLCLGLAGLALFLVYEAKYAKHPIVPFQVMSSVTSVSGYMQTFILPIILLATIYYIPVYFQACHGASPISSGVDSFGLGFTIGPISIAGGLSVTLSRKYRPQIWLGWALLIIGTGLMTLVKADSSIAKSVGFEILLGAGTGIVLTATYFPVLAPLPVSANALALSFFIFMRSFGQVWGVTIGGTVLQNELLKRLPADFTAQFPQGGMIAYSVIPTLGELPEALLAEVRVAFADSMRVMWQVLVGVAGLGFLVSLAMKQYPLHTYTDDEWGVAEGAPAHPTEKAALTTDRV